LAVGVRFGVKFYFDVNKAVVLMDFSFPEPAVFQAAFEQFHFIRPVWLWGLPVVIALWLLLRNQGSGQQWSSHIPKEMLAALKISASQHSTLWKWSLLFLCLGAVTAAAGPTWDKQTAPIVQNQSALVLVLDLSPSMLAQDLNPDRLTRAKYKLIDVLRQQADGQAALIAYAGDAHTVSPLTDDPRTIEALLPALHPNVMPSRGSNTEAAIALAQQLLSDAGLSSGDILLISDGVADDAIDNISDTINPRYRLSVLAIGGSDAAPIPATNGGFVRRANGEIILSRVNVNELRAMAYNLGGRFSVLTADDSDIQALLIDGFEAKNQDDPQESSVVYDSWVDMGHWLVLILLPLALMLFRKGALYLVPFTLPLLFLSPSDSIAADFSWNDLWQTKDQQASEQYKAGNFEGAATTFERNDWSAFANYKNKAFEQTIKQLNGNLDPRSVYNKGNALAFNGQLQEAIDAYTQVLEQNPNHEDAQHNKSVVEQLLKQQEQQQNSENSSEDTSENQKSQEDQQQSENSNSENSDSQSSDSQSSDSQNSEPKGSEPQSSTPQDAGEEQTEPENSNSDGAAQEQEESKQENEQTEPEGSEQENGQTTEDQTANSESVQMTDTGEPLKDSSEQWLRAIQDDPSGLLRRKFEYQARQRAQQGAQQSRKNAPSERY
jgi:Ca-activated chloride channel family protein